MFSIVELELRLHVLWLVSILLVHVPLVLVTSLRSNFNRETDHHKWKLGDWAIIQWHSFTAPLSKKVEFAGLHFYQSQNKPFVLNVVQRLQVIIQNNEVKVPKCDPNSLGDALRYRCCCGLRTFLLNKVSSTALTLAAIAWSVPLWLACDYKLVLELRAVLEIRLSQRSKRQASWCPIKAWRKFK